MPVLIIMAAAAYFSTTTLIAIFGFFAFLKFISRGRSSNLHFNYDKGNKLFNEFIQRSNITKLKFEPYIFAPTPAPQGIFYLLSETY